jgi:hypothetical protein
MLEIHTATEIEHHPNCYDFTVTHCKSSVAFAVTIVELMFFEFCFKYVTKIIDRAKKFIILSFGTIDSSFFGL